MSDKLPAKIIVAYRTRLVDGYVPDYSSLKAPTNYVDPAKISAYIEGKKANWDVAAARQPYTATFDSVLLADTAHGKVLRFNYRAPGSNRQSVSAAIRDWIMKTYPDAWEDSTHPSSGQPKAVFVGFDPRLFLKILGIECTMPGVDAPLPLSLWYTNSDHRDIEEAVKPTGFDGLTLAAVLKYRGIDNVVPGWQGPGVDLDKDILLISTLAAQLGLI